MNFPFTEVLKQSWQTAWKTKLFWLFGLFTGGGFMFWSFSEKDWRNINTLFFKGADSAVGLPANFLWLILLFIPLGIVMAILSYLARAAFLRGLGQMNGSASFGFGELFKFGWRKLWRLWGMDILLGLFNIPLVVVLVLTAVAAGNGSAVASGFFVATSIIMVVYNVGIMLFKHYAHCFAILEDAKAWSAIKFGWQLFLQNAGVTVVANLIAIGIFIGCGLAMIIAIIILAIPFVLLGVLMAIILGSVGAVVVAVLGGVFFLAFLLITRGLINAFMYIFMTRVFWRVKSGKGGVDPVNNASGV